MEENMNQMPGNPAMAPKKSGSLLSAFLILVVLAIILFAVVRMTDKEEMPAGESENTSDTAGTESLGPQSESDDISSIESDLDATSFESLETDLQ